MFCVAFGPCAFVNAKTIKVNGEITRRNTSYKGCKVYAKRMQSVWHVYGNVYGTFLKAERVIRY